VGSSRDDPAMFRLIFGHAHAATRLICGQTRALAAPGRAPRRPSSRLSLLSAQRGHFRNAIGKTLYRDQSRPRRSDAGLSRRNLIRSCGLGRPKRLRCAYQWFRFSCSLRRCSAKSRPHWPSRRSPIHGVPRAQGAVQYPAVTAAMSSAGRPSPALGGVCLQSPYYQGMPAKTAVQPRSYRRG
jgi:hypothetical protein